MLEQRETSQLKLFLTEKGCAHFGASKRLSLLCLSFYVFHPCCSTTKDLNELYLEKFYNALRYFSLHL